MRPSTQTLDLHKIRSSLEKDGLSLVKGAFSPGQVGNLSSLFETFGEMSRVESCPPELSTLLRSAGFTNLVSQLCGSDPYLVRLLTFAKSSKTNWFVPWHQDRTIAVQERSEMPGFDRWTMKNTVPHAEAPVGLLERMLTLRIHLDDTPQDGGALEVLAGTHKMGRLDHGAIADLVKETTPAICCAQTGDILLMKPLLVHRSKRTSATRRRVLHLEFSPDSLPPPLTWRMSATVN